MVYAKYRLSDGRFLCVWSQCPDFDPATEGVQEFLEHHRPNIRTERFDKDSPDKKRAASTQEMADYDADRNASAAQRLADTDPMVLALGEVLRREINDLRADVLQYLLDQTPIPSRTQQQILTRFKVAYQAVLTQLNRSVSDAGGLAASPAGVEDPVKGA